MKGHPSGCVADSVSVASAAAAAQQQQLQMRFPWKLHLLLQQNKDASIVSWMPDGKSFLIHNKDRFSNELLPEFFGTTNFKTFQRNLNLW